MNSPLSRGCQPLTEAVARNLAKPMAHKDAYEMVRLHGAPEFRAALRAQFEGEPGKDYTLNFYLAPPLLAARGPDQRPAKRRSGAWIMLAFHLLARLRWLRGTVFNGFGRSAARRRKRQLTEDYLALVSLFCKRSRPSGWKRRSSWRGFRKSFGVMGT